MDWGNMPRSRWGLRQLGVVLLFAAYAAAKHLLAIGHNHHGAEPSSVYLLALLAFVCGSVGSALLVLGHHLFDKIEVPERWRKRPPAVPETMPVLSITEAEINAAIAADTAGAPADRPGREPKPDVPRFRTL
jgi:hypothetical protein